MNKNLIAKELVKIAKLLSAGAVHIIPSKLVVADHDKGFAMLTIGVSFNNADLDTVLSTTTVLSHRTYDFLNKLKSSKIIETYNDNDGWNMNKGGFSISIEISGFDKNNLLKEFKNFPYDMRIFS